jgi:hypothetical protein
MGKMFVSSIINKRRSAKELTTSATCFSKAGNMYGDGRLCLLIETPHFAQLMSMFFMSIGVFP